MKSNLAVLLFAFVFVGLFSCEKESVEDPYKGKIKRVKQYSSVRDTVLRGVEEYKYDSNGRLKAIESQGGTVKFEYNANNQLIHKCYINDNPDFNDTITYIYQDGKLVIELQPSDRVNSAYFRMLKTVYEYENEKLVKTKRYRDSIFERLTVYEYKDDLLKKESIYYDSLGVDLDYTRSHYYDEHKKLSFTTSMYAASWGMEWLQTIYYFYNSHGDLDYEYAEQSENISAWISYCRRYEYY
jgi:archaellum component FlaF (FlaF/FlaG flagellin family)